MNRMVNRHEAWGADYSRARHEVARRGRGRGACGPVRGDAGS